MMIRIDNINNYLRMKENNHKIIFFLIFGIILHSCSNVKRDKCDSIGNTSLSICYPVGYVVDTIGIDNPAN